MVVEARSWVGTSFQHQGRVKGSAYFPGGCDCLGLVMGVARCFSLKTIAGQDLCQFDQTDYAKAPHSSDLISALMLHLQPIHIRVIQPADVILLKVGDNPQHLAFIGDYFAGGLSIIHAYAPVGRVTEHRLDTTWHRRIVASFSFADFA